MVDSPGENLETEPGDSAVVEGGVTLKGRINLEGFKHAFVTVLAGALMGNHRVTIKNAPAQKESDVLLELARQLGARCTRHEDSVTVEVDQELCGSLDPRLFDSIHGSLYLIPAMIAHGLVARISPAGGCAIGDSAQGARPIDQYSQIVLAFGGQVRQEGGELLLSTSGFVGTTVDLRDYMDDRIRMSGPRYSGATKFALLCAVAAKGMSRILFPYPKADVHELVDVLGQMGADLEWLSTDELLVRAGSLWSASQVVEHELVSDGIQAMTWIAVNAMTQSNISLQVANPQRLLGAMRAEVQGLERMGIGLEPAHSGLHLSVPDGPLNSVDLEVSSRKIYSDSQPFFALMLTRAQGNSRIEEHVWKRRFGYAEHLNALGCKLRVTRGAVVVSGVNLPSTGGQELRARDLRESAVSLVAALGVPGQTKLRGLHHLARGYPGLLGEVARLGGRIETH